MTLHNLISRLQELEVEHGGEIELSIVLRGYSVGLQEEIEVTASNLPNHVDLHEDPKGDWLVIEFDSGKSA